MILNDPAMFAQWKSDIAGMAGRIIEMRRVLHDLLVNKLHTPAVGPNGWDHITSQIGMFCFSGMNRESLLHLSLVSQTDRSLCL